MRKRVLSVVSACLMSSAASAAEVKVASTVAFRAVLEALAPRFAEERGMDVRTTFGSAKAISERVENGEVFDLIILAPNVLAGLGKAGKIDGASTSGLAQTSMGIAGGLSEVERPMTKKQDFLHFLEIEDAVGITDPASGAASSVHMARLLPTLGLSESAQKHIQWHPAGSFPKMVQSGAVRFWITQLSEIVPAKDVRLISRLPAELQNVTKLGGAIATTAPNRAGAEQLIQYIKNSSSVFRSKGMEPAP